MSATRRHYKLKGRERNWNPDRLIAAAIYVIGVHAKTDENGFVWRDNQRPEIAELIEAVDLAGGYELAPNKPTIRKRIAAHWAKRRNDYLIAGIFLGLAIAALSNQGGQS